MATVSRIKTWGTSDTLTAADLNAEFNNIINDYNGNITNANISASAAIAYSKLSLTGNILNADIAGGAGSVASKLAADVLKIDGAQTISGVKTFDVATKQKLVTDSDAATITFDLNAGNEHMVTLGGNRVLALSNPSVGQVFLIRLSQDDTGTRTVTWFSTIRWTGGTIPTLTTTINKADVFGFFCTGTGTYDGFIIGQNI